MWSVVEVARAWWPRSGRPGSPGVWVGFGAACPCGPARARLARVRRRVPGCASGEAKPEPRVCCRGPSTGRPRQGHLGRQHHVGGVRFLHHLRNSLRAPCNASSSSSRTQNHQGFHPLGRLLPFMPIQVVETSPCCHRSVPGAHLNALRLPQKEAGGVPGPQLRAVPLLGASRPQAPGPENNSRAVQCASTAKAPLKKAT